MSVPGGMIAAIAIVHRGRLATRNTADFRGLEPELGLINPWQS